jgi:hypothetical protein
MDAFLGSLESKATHIAAESRATAEKIIAELRAKRDAFSSDMKKQVQASEGTWLQASKNWILSGDASAEWYDFLSWGVAKGHWPTLPSMK